MSESFFFYDLETTGFNTRSDRIMQFAGQRTDADLNLIGDPVNRLIKLTPDVLPSPDAVLLTGITPQQTFSEGVSEAEFLDYFHSEVVRPNTTFLGFNSIRFDDEFMRFLNYRNYYDAYEWQWKDGCSRWDLLDLVRMTRALRPEGIKWPYNEDDQPVNRLELLSKANSLEHEHAHDALSDVMATIGLAKLIKTKQPDLFNYANSHRDKASVKEIVLKGEPFVYTSGRYAGELLHTTIVTLLAKHPEQDAALVYDLRSDPREFIDMSVEEVVESWTANRDSTIPRLPIKTLKYNRCPAVAPIGVVKEKPTQDRISLDISVVSKNIQTLKKHQASLAKKVIEAIHKLDQARAQNKIGSSHDDLTVDEKLYEAFVGSGDKAIMHSMRSSSPGKINKLADKFQDSRLQKLAPVYKARNYPELLTTEENKEWEDYRRAKLFKGGQSSQSVKFFERLQELSKDNQASKKKAYLIEELKLYGESIVPVDEVD